MKKIILTLVFGAFAFASTYAEQHQPQQRKMQKEVIAFEALPDNIRERVASRELEVEKVMAIKDMEGNLRMYTLKGTVHGEARVWRFDSEGNRISQMHRRKGQMRRGDGEMRRGQMHRGKKEMRRGEMRRGKGKMQRRDK